MLNRIRKLPSPALAISVLALVIAVGGGTFAMAALTNKKVRKISTTTANKLITKRAPKLSVSHAVSADTATRADSASKADTATNATNAATAANATGLSGPLASGKTLIGTFGTAGQKNTGFIDETGITYQIPLAAAPAFNDIAPGGASTPACPGSAAAPSAAPGNLCLYETIRTGATGLTQISPTQVRRFGAVLFATSVANGASYEVDGVWAVTAP